MPPIVKLGTVKETKNVLVFGESGCGKTILSASHGGLLLAGERGVASATSRHPATDAWLLHSWEDWLTAVKYLRDGGHKRYKWVSVDSLTEIQEFGRDFIIARSHTQNPQHSEYVLDWQEHQEWQQAFRKHLKDLCALPVNCFFTALPMTSEIGDEERVMPFIDGKKGALSQYVCGQMGAVGFMEELRVKRAGKVSTVRRTSWKLSTARDDSEVKRFGKNRYDLPAHTEDLSIPELEALMNKATTTTPARRTATRRRVASS